MPGGILPDGMHHPGVAADKKRGAPAGARLASGPRRPCHDRFHSRSASACQICFCPGPRAPRSWEGRAQHQRAGNAAEIGPRRAREAGIPGQRRDRLRLALAELQHRHRAGGGETR